MTVRRTRRWQASLVAAVAATLIAGCATTVAGSAQPAPEAIGQDTSVPPTSQAPDSIADPTAADSGSSPAPDSGSSPAPDSGSSPTDAGSSGAAGSSSESGSGPTDSSSEPDDAALYPTGPLKYNKNAKGETSQALVEGRRLAGYVVDPSVVMPEYTEGKLPTLPLKDAGSLSLLLSDPVPEVASRGGMYAGFTSTRSNKDNTGSMVDAVLEFPDAAAAKQAATDLAAAAKSDGDSKLTVPGYPAAAGWAGKSDKKVDAHAFLAAGSLVLYSWTSALPAKKAELPATVARYYKMQIEAVKGFTPTPKDKLATLPYDPDGVYARTLPVAPGKGDVTNGAYTGKAMLHYMSSYANDGKLYAETGVDAGGEGRSTVYRAKDNAGATKIRDAYYQERRAQSPDMRDYPLPGSPGITCLQDTLNASYYCTGAVGRYAFEYLSDSENDVKKSMESQIAMLTG